ncbi:MAG: hypothetical protein KAX20_06535 [Candidatus Omnitrophica bacterium]|nr:hypothetical protein [Candidatus Omnitrophota bacterium]
MDGLFNAKDVFIVRRDLFAFLGAAFRILDTEGNLLLYSRQKAFKLKEDIRVYSDLQRLNEILHIQARQIIDFSAAYDVIDFQSKEKVGALRRKGIKSIARDEWEILDKNDTQIGTVQEDTLGMALLRRFIGFIPQNYSVIINGQVIGKINQFFNPFIHKFKVDFSADTQKLLDRRLGIATAILLLAIERRQR